MARDAQPRRRARWLHRLGELENGLETRVGPWVAFGGVLALLTLGMMLVSWLGLGGDPFNDSAFDASTWRASDGTAFDCPRGPMLANLELQLRPGMSRTELVSLLGPPDATERPDSASWFVGSWSGFRVDIDSLDVAFDANGRLASWHRAQH